MTQDHADVPPEAEKAERSNVSSGSDYNILISRVKRRVGRWIIDAAVFAVCTLPVFYMFELLAHKETLEDVLQFQESLYASLSQLNPLGLFGYLSGAHGFLFWHLDTYLGYILPSVVLNKIMLVLWPVSWLLVLGFSPILLPIAVLIEGTPLEWLVVFVVFLPLAGIVLHAGSHGDDESGIVFFGLFAALGLTCLVLWFTQLAMLGALWAFGWLVKTAEIWAASSICFATLCWYLWRRLEHSITEHVVHVVRTRLFS